MSPDLAAPKYKHEARGECVYHTLGLTRWRVVLVSALADNLLIDDGDFTTQAAGVPRVIYPRTTALRDHPPARIARAASFPIRHS